ncbi:type III secretion system protein [Edwardsiella ictaluri]|nr:type III secretion system protein [Edwardsiella ictaluri]
MRTAPTSVTSLATYSTENTLSSHQLLERWKATSPPDEKEDREMIAEMIKEAYETGILSITSENITSIPIFPDGISELNITSCERLKTFPPLPDGLKRLVISQCPNLGLSSFPPQLESLSIDMTPYEGENKIIPEIPNSLLDFAACNGSYLPQLPAQLASLSVLDFSDIRCDSLPNNLKTLEVYSSPFLPLINILPDGLQELKIGNVISPPDTSIDSMLPKSLERLSIECCENIRLPTTLPVGLQHISLNSSAPRVWNIKPSEMPKNIDIYTECVKFNTECLAREDITFLHKHTDEAKSFKLGDVVYGLSCERPRVTSLIDSTLNKSKNDIVIQNTLTNAVWDRRNISQFKSDAAIAQELNDIERGISFKEFLANHPRYNVTSQQFSTLPKDELWMKTSKAGIEFQTQLRERQVIFILDSLIYSISDIASKTGEYGNAITAHELRWIYRHRDDEKVKSNVKFFLNGKSISHAEVFSLAGWEHYHPKNAIK